MQLHNVELGSPADATGKLKKGQIIESINGVVLEKEDPRIILGDIITEAEAKDGKVVLKIKDLGDVTVTIPVMGRYSQTWPMNCPKSDTIVRQLADLLAKDPEPKWGSGQLHAAGVHCMTFLVMVKLCGVEVDPYMFDETSSSSIDLRATATSPMAMDCRKVASATMARPAASRSQWLRARWSIPQVNSRCMRRRVTTRR